MRSRLLHGAEAHLASAIASLRTLVEEGWSGRVVLAIGAFAVLSLVTATFDWGPSEARATLGNVMAFLSAVTICVLARKNALDISLSVRVRRAWVFIGLAYVTLSIGNALWIVDRGASPWSHFPYLLSYPLILAAILSFPLGLRSIQDKGRFWLDVLIILTGSTMVVWHSVLRPALAQQQSPVDQFWSLAYPLSNLVVMAGVVTIWLRRKAVAGGNLVGVLAAGLCLNLMADIGYAYQSLHGVYADGGLLDALWDASDFLLALSAVMQRRETATADVPVRAARPTTVLPALALALGYGPVFSIVANEATQPVLRLVLGTVLLTTLVVLRQVMSVRESRRLLAESTARQSEARFRALVQNSSDVIAILDPDTRISFLSPAVTKEFGYSREELVGTNLADLVHPDDLVGAKLALSDTVRSDRATRSGDWRIRHHDGRWLFTENVLTNLLSEPTVSGVVLTTRNATERRALEEQLTHQAFHDPLTQLPNRALFMDRVAHAMTRSARSTGAVAVLFLDLDNLKIVNDSLGHTQGDQLLVSAAERLIGCVRSSDTVARLGGDEFAVLIEDPDAHHTAVAVAERIAGALTWPLALGKDARVGVSIGIACSQPGDTYLNLLRSADVAMYFAKSQGKGRYEVFEPQMQTSVLERLRMEADLRKAVDREEFCLYYQPIVRLVDGELVGFEALLRWRHPDRGLLAPGLFIGLAEQTGMIVPIGGWALRQACWQWSAWSKLRGRRPPFKLSVNLSGRHLESPTVVDDVRTALAETGMDPRYLVLEITESILMKNTDAPLKTLRGLKALGVSLAIDDFGTGYSSLGYLQRFPIDILKIDKSFVDEVGPARDAVLARVVVGLAETMKLQTVAEGIETADQARGLIALGCRVGQGFHFDRPLTVPNAEALLRASTCGGWRVEVRGSGIARTPSPLPSMQVGS